MSYSPTFLGQFVPSVGFPSDFEFENVATDGNHLVFKDGRGYIHCVNLGTNRMVSIANTYTNEEDNCCIVYSDTIITREGNNMLIYDANSGSQRLSNARYGMKILNSEFLVKDGRIYFITSTGNVCSFKPGSSSINQFENSQEIKDFIQNAGNNTIVQFPAKGIGFTSYSSNIIYDAKCLVYREDMNTIVLK